MALKRQDNLMSAFSMASMTDVIFLLLIFFMVTSTFVFPTALDINLPQSTQQTSSKPSIRIYIDNEGNLATVSELTEVGDDEQFTLPDIEPRPMQQEELEMWLQLAHEHHPDAVVALHADVAVPYGRVVEILNIGAKVDVKIVLATKPTSPSATEADDAQPQVENANTATNEL